jgi:hypothetical protein
MKMKKRNGNKIKACFSRSQAAFIFAIALIALTLSCRTEEQRYRASVPDGVYLFEAETFRLVDAEIIDDPAASDGKAVRILSSRAFCSIDINLPPGAYVARARARAVDDGHDEFYLSVGNFSAKLTPEAAGRYAYCPAVMEFRINAPGRDYLQFAAFSSAVPQGETGAVVDLLEVWEKTKWEERTTDNTDKN